MDLGTVTSNEELRAEINSAIDMAERVQVQWNQYREAIEQLQSTILLLDLQASNNVYASSAMRMAPLIGRELSVDAEIIGQVKTNLQDWLPYV